MQNALYLQVRDFGGLKTMNEVMLLSKQTVKVTDLTAGLPVLGRTKHLPGETRGLVRFVVNLSQCSCA